MKCFIRALYTDIKKSVFSYGFITCIIVTFMLCFTSVIYTTSDGREYSVIEILFNRNKFSNINFKSSQILNDSISPYLTMFLPIVSALPYVTFFCGERVTNCMRFIITRSGKHPYYTAKFFSATFSGGLAIMLGFSVYSFIICYFFPSNEISFVYIIKLLLGMALYGMISVLPAFFLSSFLKNKYMICCFPFIFMHFYYTTISRIQNKFIAQDDYDTVAKLYFLYPDVVKRLFFEVYWQTIIYHLCLALTAFLGFVFFMNRRLDYGE